MTVYVALLRAVNVGGTGKLAMNELRALCVEAGFRNVHTFIASGNVIFESDASASQTKRVLEAELRRHAGRQVDVLLRNAAEMRAVLDGNPFREAPADRVVAIFLDDVPPPEVLAAALGRVDEELRLCGREIYVHYPSGQGRSRLKIPDAARGTARNMNTVAKLVEMAEARADR
jgi:uncharacterized protein (DUF1697 family)